MSKVKVYLEGQFIASCDLPEQEPFVFGRGEGSSFRLEAFPGISREHFRIRKIDGSWILEVLSRYGELYVDGQKQSGVGLRDGLKFSVPPYDFEFELSDQAAEAGYEERTEIKQGAVVPFLKIIDSRGQSLGKYKLEGDEWICGRDTHHAIFLEHPKVSREQFVVQKQEQSYLIKNLSRSNPTRLNGKTLSDSGWSPLSSGDILQVADIQFFFDLVDLSFSDRVAGLDSVPIQEIVGADNDFGQEAAFSAPLYGDYPSSGESNQQSQYEFQNVGFRVLKFGPLEIELNGKNKFRLALVAVAFAAVLLFSYFEQSPQQKSTNAGEMSSPFDRLPPDQQDIVRQAYSAAQLLLAQGRYEMTKQELAKIHRLIPFYEDSKQMEETADQGLAIVQERERLAAIEQEKAEVEAKIQAQLKECQKVLHPNVTLEEFEICISPILQFDPEYPGLVNMRNEVLSIIAQREADEARRREYAARVKALQDLFKKAEIVEADGQALPTLAAYRRVVNSSLPDPGGLKAKARAKINEISSMMDSLQSKAEQESEDARKAGDYRRAILIVREALRFNPENEVLKARHAQLMKELTELMMVIYQEGILEESIGNVEAAKGHWEKIRSQSLSGEEYFVKATIKLQRYGAARDQL